ncbi:MAG TPA: Fur family transcriptional regulator [Dehalococcoidia bacterium]
MTVLSETGELVDDLRGQGFKITTPRYRVIEWLVAHENNFTAEELATELAEVGRATVYRTLKLLQDQDLVCKVVLGDGSVAYRMSHKVHHHHLVCLSCGATEDIGRCGVDDVIASVREVTDYDVVGHRIEIYGICPDCQRVETV